MRKNQKVEKPSDLVPKNLKFIKDSDHKEIFKRLLIKKLCKLYPQSLKKFTIKWNKKLKTNAINALKNKYKYKT